MMANQRVPYRLSRIFSSMLLTIDELTSFEGVRDWPASMVNEQILARVRTLDEKTELEPFLREALFDPNATPHGPAEIADIFTHKIRVDSTPRLAAFLLKGRSFPVVRPSHVAHQIYRLEKIADLGLAVLVAAGTILDQAKEQFVSTASRLGCDYCVMDAVDIGRVLIAYGFLCPRDGRRIVGGRCNCGYLPAARLTNMLQEYAIRALATAHRLRQASALVILPTGSGKTRVAARDAASVDARRILYIAHTHEILDVAEAEFSTVFGANQIRRPRVASHFREHARVNLCTIQFASRHVGAIARWMCDYLVVDEFHHAAAVSYRKLLGTVRPQFLLGLTATPFREDRQDIAALCGDNVVVQHELRTGIETGVLCPYHYYGCFDDVDYSKIRNDGRRYTIRDLERALIIPQRDNAIVSKYLEKAENLPTLAFCCTHRHADRVVAAFRERGIPAEGYIATTARSERQRLVERLQSGKLRVLVTVDVLNEGADIPFIECLLFLRPTDSKRIFFQQLGRGLRRYVGKTRRLVIDFIGNFKNAYRIVEYQGLMPYETEGMPELRGRCRKKKDVLNLPQGCEVHFDDRVVDLFARQLLDPRGATRQNIGRILLYQLERLRIQLRRVPTRKDVRMYSLLGPDLYDLVFGGVPDLAAWDDGAG